MQKKLLTIAALLIMTLGLAPVSLAGFSMVPSKDDTRRQFNFELTQGESRSDTVVIENNNTNDLTLLLYGADATHSNQGSFALVNRTATQRTVGNWIKFKESTITLKAGEKREIPFTIAIPGNVTPGNYAGGIAAETTTVQNPAGNNKSGNTGAGVVISSRLVVKLFVSVPGDKNIKYEWTDFSHMMTPNGKHRCLMTFQNDGNAAITVDPSIEISGFPGIIPENIKVAETILLPGEKITIPFEWDKKPFFGFFTVKASTTFWEYDIANNQNINEKTLTKTITFSVIPWNIAAVILTVLAVILIYVVSKTMIMRNLKKSSKTHEVQEGETLVSLATKAGIDWKKLAKLNKIKPPYNIKKGDKLLVPLKK